MATDGPFGEGKEIVRGYLVIKAGDLPDAIEIAENCPIFDCDGMVKVREIQHPHYVNKLHGGPGMPRTIVQTVRFNAPPEVLFALYVNSRQHTAATGGHAAISSKVGGICEAWGGSLRGVTLGVVRNRVFVQTWRADDWKPEAADSVLTFFFEKDGKGGKVTMVHANIPDERYPGIKTGWTTYYWAPWKRYLAKRGKRK